MRVFFAQIICLIFFDNCHRLKCLMDYLLHVILVPAAEYKCHPQAASAAVGILDCLTVEIGSGGRCLLLRSSGWQGGENS